MQSRSKRTYRFGPSMQHGVLERAPAGHRMSRGWAGRSDLPAFQDLVPS